MKTLFAAAVCAFSLLSAGIALAYSENGSSASIWAKWMFGVSVIWQPFLFAFVIVGFGAWVLQRLYKKVE